VRKTKRKEYKMDALDETIKAVEAAIQKDFKNKPVRLSTLHTQYKKTSSEFQRAVKNIEKINRNAEVIIIKKGTA